MDLMFEISVIENKYKRRIDLVFDDAVLSQQQVAYNRPVSGQPAGLMPSSQPIRIKHS